jgi:hypothetical protein
LPDAEQVVSVGVAGRDADGRGSVDAGLPRIAELDQPARHEPAGSQIARVEPRSLLHCRRAFFAVRVDEQRRLAEAPATAPPAPPAARGSSRQKR